MKPEYKFTRTEIIKAIKGSKGSVLNVAIKLGVAWGVAKKFIKKYELEEKLRLDLVEYKESLVDVAEDMIVTLIRDGEFNAIRKVLDDFGTKRGWGSSTKKVEHSGELTQNVKIDPFARIRENADIKDTDNV